MNELLLKSWKVLALRGAISLVFRYETHTRKGPSKKRCQSYWYVSGNELQQESNSNWIMASLD